MAVDLGENKSYLICEPSNRDEYGKFTRVYKLWSLDNFDDGYVDGSGRFRVYSPYHHRADKKYGMVLRSIIAYETYNDDIVTKEYAIHHKSGNRLDDSVGNLTKLKFGEHSSLHNSSRIHNVERICVRCSKKFMIKRHRLNAKDWKRGSYCSTECYFNRGRKQ